MHRERVLHFGEDCKFLVSEKGDIRSPHPFFLSTLGQLEILILKSQGFRNREIGPILFLSDSVRNSMTELYKANQNSYYQILHNAIKLSLLNTISVRGIITLLEDDRLKREHTLIVESMEKAIKERSRKKTQYGIFPKEFSRIVQAESIPILLPKNQEALAVT